MSASGFGFDQNKVQMSTEFFGRWESKRALSLQESIDGRKVDSSLDCNRMASVADFFA
jgi:hypothetical protein